MDTKIKNHTCLISYDDVREICGEFLNRFQLRHLNFIRSYSNGTVIYLCNNSPWLQHYLEMNYPAIGAFEQRHELSELKYVLWTGLGKDKVLQDAREIFNIYYGMTVIRKEKTYFDFFNFGSNSRNPSIVNDYINNLDAFEQFIDFFYEKSNPLIKTAERTPLILPKSTKEIIKVSDSSIKNLDQPKSIRKRYYLGEEFNNQYLTNREIECIKWILMEKTAEEIGILLNINKRTVEVHIEKIKRKFNCTKQFQLGYKIGRYVSDLF